MGLSNSEKSDMYKLLTEEEVNEIQEIESHLNILSEVQQTEANLKVALIGEVKAGNDVRMISWTRFGRI